jgi:hypothetical protein
MNRIVLASAPVPEHARHTKEESMDTKKIVILALVGTGLLFAVSFVGCAFGFRGDCVRAEAGIKAQYEQNKNNYDNMWKKFKEMAQVPEMYAADMKKVYDSAIQGRYGEGGSKAVFQFIQEHNPQLDPSVYVKLQSAIEAGRNSFMADQQQLIDKKREYEVILNGNRALFLNWWGYPKIDLDKYGIVTSDVTEDAFGTKRSEEIDLR